MHVMVPQVGHLMAWSRQKSFLHLSQRTLDFSLQTVQVLAMAHYPVRVRQRRQISLAMDVTRYYPSDTKPHRFLELVNLWSEALLLFICRNCGKSSEDIDTVLEGSCSCGCSHFHLVSQDRSELPEPLDTKEAIRRDLHRWLDLNLDSMPPESVGNIRVMFEIEKDHLTS